MLPTSSSGLKVREYSVGEKKVQSLEKRDCTFVQMKEAITKGSGDAEEASIPRVPLSS